jgi:hypothetical protein
METKISIIPLNEIYSIQFIYIPKGYVVKSQKIENHKVHKIGKLNSFNRIKILENWRKQIPNLKEHFTEILQKNGFDLKEFPNPLAFLIELKPIKNINI